MTDAKYNSQHERKPDVAHDDAQNHSWQAVAADIYKPV